METRYAPAFKVVLSFLAIYIVWGTTYLAISFGLKDFPPFILSAFRFFSAGFLLLVICRARKEPLPSWNITRACIISGAMMLTGGSGLVTLAEKYVNSGHAAIIVAIEPFLFLLLDRHRWPFYFSNKLIVAGLVTGFAGIVLFIRFSANGNGTSAGGHMFIIANAILLLSTVLWVLGSIYAKNKLVSRDSNSMTTALQLLAAGLGSGVIGVFTGEWRHFSLAGISLSSWAGLVYLAGMGSLVAYVAFTWLISIRPPAIVSTYTYINPVVAVILGWVVANERLSMMQFVAIAIILAGMLLTNLPNYRELKKS